MFGEKIVDGDKEKTIAIKLVSRGFSLIKDYPNGCHAIVYGAVSLDERQDANYLDIVMWINDCRQIIKVEWCFFNIFILYPLFITKKVLPLQWI